MHADERFESLRDAEPIVNRVVARRGLDDRPLGGFELRRGLVGKAPNRGAQRFARVGVGLDLQPRRKRRDDRVDRGDRGRLVLLPALGSLTDRVGGFRAHFGQRVSQRGQDVGNERWALQPAQRADGDLRGLRIAAARSGANDGEIVRRRRAAVLGLQDRQPRRLRRRRADEKRRITAENAKHAEQRNGIPHPSLCALSVLRGKTSLDHSRKCRVAAEYSSIWAVRSCGYEMVTSVISPDPLLTASSRGITKPLYEGNRR